MNHVFGDGHVDGLSDSMDGNVYLWLTTRNGGERRNLLGTNLIDRGWTPSSVSKCKLTAGARFNSPGGFFLRERSLFASSKMRRKFFLPTSSLVLERDTG